MSAIGHRWPGNIETKLPNKALYVFDLRSTTDDKNLATISVDFKHLSDNSKLRDHVSETLKGGKSGKINSLCRQLYTLHRNNMWHIVSGSIPQYLHVFSLWGIFLYLPSTIAEGNTFSQTNINALRHDGIVRLEK